MDNDRIIRDLHAQLKVLYEEKRALHNRFGVSDMSGLSRFIERLELRIAHLNDAQHSEEDERK